MEKGLKDAQNVIWLKSRQILIQKKVEAEFVLGVFLVKFGLDGKNTEGLSKSV